MARLAVVTLGVMALAACRGPQTTTTSSVRISCFTGDDEVVPFSIDMPTWINPGETLPLGPATFTNADTVVPWRLNIHVTGVDQPDVSIDSVGTGNSTVPEVHVLAAATDHLTVSLTSLGVSVPGTTVLCLPVAGADTTLATIPVHAS